MQLLEKHNYVEESSYLRRQLCLISFFFLMKNKLKNFFPTFSLYVYNLKIKFLLFQSFSFFHVEDAQESVGSPRESESVCECSWAPYKLGNVSSKKQFSPKHLISK